MRTPRLTDSQITDRLGETPDWFLVEGMLTRTFVFPDFVAAIAFVNAVAEAAEQVDHHPDITIRYNQVTLALTTHDSGGLTELDFALAQTASLLAG